MPCSFKLLHSDSNHRLWISDVHVVNKCLFCIKLKYKMWSRSFDIGYCIFKMRNVIWTLWDVVYNISKLVASLYIWEAHSILLHLIHGYTTVSSMMLMRNLPEEFHLNWHYLAYLTTYFLWNILQNLYFLQEVPKSNKYNLIYRK